MNPRPKLRRDLVFVEQTYRGEQSYILKDPESFKYYRFGPVEVRVMQALDGERTSAEAAAALVAGGLRVSSAVVEKFANKLTAMGLCERTVGERSVLLLDAGAGMLGVVDQVHLVDRDHLANPVQ